MQKTAPPPLPAPKGPLRQRELLPFSRARVPGIRRVLSTTGSRVQRSHRGDFNAMTCHPFGRYQVLHKLEQGAMSACGYAPEAL